MKYLIENLITCKRITTEIAISMGCGLNPKDETYQFFGILNHPSDETIGALIIPEDYEYLLEDSEILQLKSEEEMVVLGWEIN